MVSWHMFVPVSFIMVINGIKVVWLAYIRQCLFYFLSFYLWARTASWNPAKDRGLNINNFNLRASATNHLICQGLANCDYGIYVKHKGLFYPPQLEAAFSDDGVHLNTTVGYKKYFHNLRGAISATLRRLWVYSTFIRQIWMSIIHIGHHSLRGY